MEKPIEDRTPLSQLGLFMFIWMAVLIAFSFVQPYLMTAFVGKQPEGELLSSSATISAHLWFFRLIQCAYTIIVFMVPPFIFSRFQKESPSSFLGLNRVPSFRLLLISTLIIVFSLPFIYYTYQQNQQINFGGEINDLIDKSEDAINKFTTALMVMRNPAELIVNLIMFAILPALGEELFFRGGVQKLFARTTNSGHMAIIFTAIFFSAVHFEFHGFIPRLILAIVFGYMYYWSRNLWLPIFAHMIYNGYQVVLVYYVGEDKLDKLQLSDYIPYAAVVVSAILLFLSMSWLYRRTMGSWIETLEDTGE